MRIQAKVKDTLVKRNKGTYPKILSYYNKSDYITQQKARFIFYLCIAASVGIILLMFSSIYVQLNSVEYNGIFYPVILSEIALIFFVGICFFLLIKGKYGIASHLFMTVSMACVWYVMYVHGGNVITRLDTVVLIIALLNLTPLFITKFKITILFYILVNVLILIFFVQIAKDQIGLSDASAVDYIVDTSIAMIFSGIVGYNIFRINKQSLEKAKSDNQQRREVEKSLKESEEKYRTLMENMNDIVMMVDNDDRIQYVNNRFCEKLGYADNEVIGEIGYKLLLDSKDEEIIIKANENRTKNIISQYELTFTAKDGRKIDFLISGTPVRNSNGEVIGSIGNMMDITERKKAEKALKESQQLFQTLALDSPVGIFRTKPNGYTTYVNPKWIELSGLRFEEAIGDGWLNAVHPEDKEKLQNNWGSHYGKREKSTAEYRFIKPDGSIVWVLGYAVPEIVDNKIMGYIGTITDITEKKKIENELEKHRHHLEFLVQERTEELATSNEELLSTNEELHNQREELEAVLLNLQNTQKQLINAEKMASLGVLASGVAHEINNPLNFIKGGVFGLEQYFDENLKEHKDEVSDLIDGINTGVDRAADIVTSLNHYSRRDDTNVIECDIHSIIDNCLVILRNQIKDRIQIKKNYTSKSHLLYGNEGSLHQAMLNILSNAVQAIEESGVIDINTSLSKQIVTILVSDTGSGIHSENMSKIFDPFFTTKEQGKGTGLGLSITHNIIEEHNGTIELESNIGRGSIVTIKLPLKKQKNDR